MKVVYRLQALADIHKHFAYIANDDPAAAVRVASSIYRSITRLEVIPYSGRRGGAEGTYELIIPGLPYIVAYRVHSFVEILAVFHTSTNKPRG